MMIIWAVVIGLIIWAVVRGNERSTRRTEPPATDDPVEIARKRYARGEITREELEEIKKNLA